MAAGHLSPEPALAPPRGAAARLGASPFEGPLVPWLLAGLALAMFFRPDGGPGGLLDVALDPGHAANRRVWWSYAEAGSGGKGLAVGRRFRARSHWGAAM